MAVVVCVVVRVVMQTHTSYAHVHNSHFHTYIHTCILPYMYTYIHAYIHAYLPRSHCLALGVTWLLLPGGAAPSAWALCAPYLLNFFQFLFSALYHFYYLKQLGADRTAAGRCPLDGPTGPRPRRKYYHNLYNGD